MFLFFFHFFPINCSFLLRRKTVTFRLKKQLTFLKIPKCCQKVLKFAIESLECLHENQKICEKHGQ